MFIVYPAYHVMMGHDESWWNVDEWILCLFSVEKLRASDVVFSEINIPFQEHPDAGAPHGGVRDPRGPHVRSHHHEQGAEQPVLPLPVRQPVPGARVLPLEALLDAPGRLSQAVVAQRFSHVQRLAEVSL